MQYCQREFYSKLTGAEATHVSDITDMLVKHYRSIPSPFAEPYLIAGVGSIFAATEPEDIDLVITGLRYTIDTATPDNDFVTNPTPAQYFSRGWPYVIWRFFEKLCQGEGEHLQVPELCSRDSSVPCMFFNQEHTLEGLVARAVVETEEGMSLGEWMGHSSVGVRATYTNCRPIDIMFVFGKNPQQWRQLQGENDYAVLFERR